MLLKGADLLALLKHIFFLPHCHMPSFWAHAAFLFQPDAQVESTSSVRLNWLLPVSAGMDIRNSARATRSMEVLMILRTGRGESRLGFSKQLSKSWPEMHREVRIPLLSCSPPRGVDLSRQRGRPPLQK